jgi:hypothetical protein
MNIRRTLGTLLTLTASVLAGSAAWAQDMPADYGAVLTALGKKGDLRTAC